MNSKTDERKRSGDLAALSQLVCRLSEAGPDVDILNLIAEGLRTLTGALVTSLCTYDSEARMLTVKHIACDNQALQVLSKRYPTLLAGHSIPVSPAFLGRMLSNTIHDLSGFSDATLGLVSDEDERVLQKELGIDAIKGLTFRHGGELIGVSALLLPQQSTPPSDDIIRIFVHIAATALRRKKAEDTLSEKEIRYRTLVENFPNGAVLMFDPSLRHTIADGADMATLGLSKNIVGKTIDQSFPPEIAALLKPQYLATLSGKSSAFEMQFGKSLCEMRFTPVRDEGGRVTAGIVMIQNITDRKRAEDALWRAYDEMEIRVRERTEELDGLNAALEKENAERRRAEEQLKASLDEKEVLLRELYHRTKNNMQVIRSMLALQAHASHNDEVKKIIRDTESRIQTMALVHQKLYQSQSLSSIDLKDYIQDLAHLLMQSYGVLSQKISLDLELETVHVPIDTAIPCGLILNELLSNSFKHAFPGERKGEIHIRLLKADAETVALDFSDDGVGVPKGFDLKNQETLGLQSIFTIVRHQLRGETRFENRSGLAFHIRFKNNLYASRV
jgi:two-component sensor histidine kinase/PAS domain-containing protein